MFNDIKMRVADSIWNDACKTIPEDSLNQIICIKEDGLAIVTIGKIVCGTKKWTYFNDLLNISDVQSKEEDLVEELDYDDYVTFFKEHPEYNNEDWGFEETWTFGQYCYKLGLKAAQKGE